MSGGNDDSGKDIRVVVCIDFGTTYSGFGYAHVHTPTEIIVPTDKAPGSLSTYKSPTVIKYKDASCDTIESWGYRVFSKQKKKAKSTSNPIVELFKLHLLGEVLEEKERPFLPDGIDFRKVIIDYLKELCTSLKDGLDTTWPNLNLHEQTLIVLTVPAEFDENAIETLRDCASKAGLIKDIHSDHLIFMTEPEAAAIYCLKTIMKEEYKLNPGDSFMVVDCGGGTVDLTTRELLENEELSEVTERRGYHCGSSFVDKAFLDFIGERVGDSVIDKMKKNHYSQLQHFVLEFCRYVKFSFTGIESDYNDYEIDLDSIPTMKGYVEGEKKKSKSMQESDWLIEIHFEDVKAMFDPIIKKIIDMIKEQLDQNQKICSAMFLVGGFSESKYLQTRIKDEFKEITISVPSHPVKSVIQGGVLYGLDEKVVKNRILRETYGTDTVRRWQPNDPPSPNGYTTAFEPLIKRGSKISQGEKVATDFKPFSLSQESIGFDVYHSYKKDVKYCDEVGVTSVGKWEIKLPEKSGNAEDDDFVEDVITLTLTFDSLVIRASAENQRTKEKYEVEFSRAEHKQDKQE